MLTGKVPFECDTPVKTAVAHVKEKFPSIRKIMPSCPQEVEQIINICTKKNPSERYSNVNEFYKDLCRIKGGERVKGKKTCFFKRLFGGKKWEDKSYLRVVASSKS